MKKTALFDLHCQAGAKMVPFSGWEMPIHYGSQVNEHHIVRQDAGLFDVSHMTIVDLEGGGCERYLRYLLANDVAKLTVLGKALYSCMLNEDGGVIDDLIVYKLSDTRFRLVVNAGTRDKDLAWISKQAASFDITVQERQDLSMIAIQGPKAQQVVQATLSDYQEVQALKPFHAVACGDYFVANTGYTGEKGYEVILPSALAPRFWEALVKGGAKPCGLGARDTLRLEAGLNLYGQDMDETITPWEANLAWTVSMNPADRHFIGRSALEAQKKAGIRRVLVGLLLQGKGVLRQDQVVLIEGVGEGVITSGSFSPTLGKGIAFALVPLCDARECQVIIRERCVLAAIVNMPFVRHGKPLEHVLALCESGEKI